MQTYEAFLIYAGMLFLIASGGLVWIKRRRDIKRFFGMSHYHDEPRQTRMF